MLPKKYRSRVVSINNPFDDIITLEFESLAGKYKYYPGQFLHLAIDSDYDGSGQWPESRCFSMQSNPIDETIRITYSVKGRFTGNMKDQINVGTELWLKLPYGELFTQEHNKINTVFIAGGTGLTPFLSLFTHHSFNAYTSPMVYLGFRSRFYNIYENELKFLKQNRIKIFYEDVDGVIDINSVFLENSTKNDYFLSGPPAMIKKFKQLLTLAGVPSKQVLTDEWE
jgi:ferredoxin-NADP reductase